MNKSKLNPFPDYPVTRLMDSREAGPATVLTPGVRAGRELVDKFVSGLHQVPQGAQTGAALCAVRGDYGTGKTFLLNDVAAYLCQTCGTTSPPTILRATCIETDPLSWFKSKVGQRLDELPLGEIALRLYGRAGAVVAGRTALTDSAVALLQADPTRIRDLIRSNQLSVDEVGREFQKQLDVVCKDYDETVRRVLARLVASETERTARQWISGAALSARDAELLGVPTEIDSADRVSSLIGAIAAMHRAVGRPFVLLVDELEHFARHDIAQRSWSNVTWLKRLLEHLGDAGALALVAGHWDAWKTTADYLDRFPQHSPIDLVKLKANDVAEIVERFLGARPVHFGEQQCRAIATATGGNMRRVMSLCNLLFRQTDGFALPLTEAAIQAAWLSVAQRIPQDQALEETASLLDKRGFETSTESLFGNLHFDLVARRADGRVILLEAKHADTQGAHYDAARRFIDKLDQVTRDNPKSIGMFLVNGSVDDELLRVLRSGGRTNVRWFDLTARDVLSRIETEIASLDGVMLSPTRSSAELHQAGLATTAAALPTAVLVPATAPIAAPADAQLAALQQATANLERRLRELDARRGREVQELQERLSRASQVNSERHGSPREESIQQETDVSRERARARYEALLEQPSIHNKLRYFGPALTIGVAYVTCGLLALLFDERIFSALSVQMDPRLMQSLMIIFGVMTAFAGVWLIWRRYAFVAEYFETTRRTIRDLYLRDVPISELERVSAIFRRSIESEGVGNARREALKKLKQSNFSEEVRDYVAENLERRAY